jgi:hypothetical protein
MKNLIRILPFALLIASAQESKAQISLPSGKLNSENTEIIPVREPKAEQRETNIPQDDEKLALSMLNTTEVPSDFPRMQSDMSPVTYEKLVYEWFQRNPDKRKQTTSTPQ